MSADASDPMNTAATMSSAAPAAPTARTPTADAADAASASTPKRGDEPLFITLVGDYSDGPVTYTITAVTVDGVPVEPDLTDLFDLVLDQLGGSPCNVE